MKVVALKKSTADKKADKDVGLSYPGGDDEGVSVHLSHHHLKKMGIDGELTPGHKVKFRGHGHVQSAEKDGHARLVLTHSGMDHEEPDADDKGNERERIRSDLKKAYTESEAKRK